MGDSERRTTDDYAQGTAPPSLRAAAVLSERGRATAESPAAAIARAAPAGHQALAAPPDSQRRSPRTGRAGWGFARARPGLQLGHRRRRRASPPIGLPDARGESAIRGLDSIAPTSSSPTSGVSWADQLISCPRPKGAKGVGIRRFESIPPSPLGVNMSTRSPLFRFWRRFGSHRATASRGEHLRVPGASADLRSDAPCGVDDRGLSGGSERL